MESGSRKSVCNFHVLAGKCWNYYFCTPSACEDPMDQACEQTSQFNELSGIFPPSSLSHTCSRITGCHRRGRTQDKANELLNAFENKLSSVPQSSLVFPLYFSVGKSEARNKKASPLRHAQFGTFYVFLAVRTKYSENDLRLASDDVSASLLAKMQDVVTSCDIFVRALSLHANRNKDAISLFQSTGPFQIFKEIPSLSPFRSGVCVLFEAILQRRQIACKELKSFFCIRPHTVQEQGRHPYHGPPSNREVRSRPITDSLQQSNEKNVLSAPKIL